MTSLRHTAGSAAILGALGRNGRDGREQRGRGFYGPVYFVFFVILCANYESCQSLKNKQKTVVSILLGLHLSSS